MKIILLDQDIDYSNRLKRYMEKKYRDLQIVLCNNVESMGAMIQESSYDVVLFDAAFESVNKDDYTTKFGGAAFAYISSTHEFVNGEETIYKYIPISEIYNEICTLYEKKKNRVIKKDKPREVSGTQFIGFLPANGGAGSSTMAVACALALAEKKSVLYINMEQRPSDAVFFEGKSKKCLSDIVAVLRTKYNDNIMSKALNEAIQEGRTEDGKTVSYIKGYKNIMDSLSMTGSYVEVIFNCLKNKFSYDVVVIDADYIVSDFLNGLITHCDDIVFVMSGSDTSDVKFGKIKRHLEVLGRGEEVKMPENHILLNQYYSSNSYVDQIDGIEVIAKLARYRTDNGTRISSCNVLNEVLRKKGLFDCFDYQKPDDKKE